MDMQQNSRGNIHRNSGRNHKYDDELAEINEMSLSNCYNTAGVKSNSL